MPFHLESFVRRALGVDAPVLPPERASRARRAAARRPPSRRRLVIAGAIVAVLVVACVAVGSRRSPAASVGRARASVTSATGSNFADTADLRAMVARSDWCSD